MGVRRLLHEVYDERDAELEAPFGRRLALNFEAFGREHHAELWLNDALFEEGAVSRYTTEEGEEVVERPRAVVYTGTFLDGGWIRATVHEHDVISAMWLDKTHGQVSMLVPAHQYETTLPAVAARAAEQGGRMLAFHLHEMDHSEHDRELLSQWLGHHLLDPTPREGLPEIPPPLTSGSSVDSFTFSIRNGMDAHTSNSSFSATMGVPEEGNGKERELQTLPSIFINTLAKSLSPYGLMEGCPSTTYRAAMGIAADAGFTRRLTGLGTTTEDTAAAVRRVNNDIQTQLNIVNFLYVDMSNIFISVAETFVKTTPGGKAGIRSLWTRRS